MKKIFKFAAIFALAALTLSAVSCSKDDKDNEEDKPIDNPVDPPVVDDYAPVTGESDWSIIGSLSAHEKVNMNWDGDLVMVQDGDIYSVKNLKLAAADEFKIRFQKDWGVNRGGNFESLGNGFAVWHDGPNIKVGAEGTYDVYYNAALEQIAVCAANGNPTWAENQGPQPGGSREGKALKYTAELSENYLFEKDEYADLGAGATFEVKFYANSWKTSAVDRVCTFETRDENPAMLVRFSCDGTQPGQLRFNNNAWGIGGADGVKLTDGEGNPYIFAAEKWHVLTMVLTPGEEGAVTVDFYDNGTFINSAAGKATDDAFYFQRFELGMSWDDRWDNTGYSASQLFNGYIDYARVWTRPLAASEIVANLCDVEGDAEGLLAYWIFGETNAAGLTANKASDHAYDINWANMFQMDGNNIRKNLDLATSVNNALEETDKALCDWE